MEYSFKIIRNKATVVVDFSFTIPTIYYCENDEQAIELEKELNETYRLLISDFTFKYL